MIPCIATQPLGGTWGVLGRGHIAPGLAPDSATATWNTWGPDGMSFTMARDGSKRWSDLEPLCQVRLISPAGGVCWAGRVQSVTPTDTGLTAVCQGLQYALDDDQWDKLWVRNRINGWVDARAGAGSGALPGNIVQDTDVQVLTGNQVRITLPNRALANTLAAVAILDLGPATTGTSVSVDWANLLNSSASVNFTVQGWDTAAGGGAINCAGSPTATSAMAATGTVTGDLASPKRYIAVMLQVNAGVTLANPLTITITACRVFGAASYRTASASNLTAPTVIKEVQAALGWLSTDQSRIGTPASPYTIPHLTTEGQYETHRATLQRVNAYHDNLIGVDELGRLFFQDRPTTPLIEVGSWSGNTFRDAGDTLDDLVNQVLVTGTNLAGETILTQVTSAATPLTRAGVTRKRALSVQSPVTSAVATQIGSKWITRRSQRPTRGSIVLQGPGAARWVNGLGSVTPCEAAARMSGQLVRIGGLTTPDTGGIGRESTVISTSWDATTDTATLQLDGTIDHLDALMSRYAALQSVRPTSQ